MLEKSFESSIHGENIPTSSDHGIFSIPFGKCQKSKISSRRRTLDLPKPPISFSAPIPTYANAVERRHLVLFGYQCKICFCWVDESVCGRLVSNFMGATKWRMRRRSNHRILSLGFSPRNPSRFSCVSMSPMTIEGKNQRIGILFSVLARCRTESERSWRILTRDWLKIAQPKCAIPCRRDSVRFLPSCFRQQLPFFHSHLVVLASGETTL